jgi:hypothetical protein
MRYELTHEEWAAIKPMRPNKPRGVPGERPARSHWLLRGLTIRDTVRDLPDNFDPLHDLLQSLRSLATSGRVDQNHERSGTRP